MIPYNHPRIEQKWGSAINNVEQQTYLTSLIKAATSFIEQYCRRTFVQQTITQPVALLYRSSFLLPKIPIISITSITESTTREVVNPKHYRILNPNVGTIEIQSRLDHIEVVYQAGYLNIPDAILNACASLVLWQDSTQSIGASVVSRGMGDQEVRIDPSIPIDIKETLKLWRVPAL